MENETKPDPVECWKQDGQSDKPYKIDGMMLRFVDAPNEPQPCTKHCELYSTPHCSTQPCGGGHFYRFNWLIPSDRRTNE